MALNRAVNKKDLVTLLSVGILYIMLWDTSEPVSRQKQALQCTDFGHAIALKDYIVALFLLQPTAERSRNTGPILRNFVPISDIDTKTWENRIHGGKIQKLPFKVLFLIQMLLQHTVQTCLSEFSHTRIAFLFILTKADHEKTLAVLLDGSGDSGAVLIISNCFYEFLPLLIWVQIFLDRH